MEYVALSFLVLCVLGILACVYLLFKNDNTCRKLCRVSEAIYQYNVSQIRKDRSLNIIPYSVIRDYDAAFYDLFNWGYRDVVPSDVFEKIKPFIAK